MGRTVGVVDVHYWGKTERWYAGCVHVNEVNGQVPIHEVMPHFARSRWLNGVF
jgi:hypothetical protein